MKNGILYVMILTAFCSCKKNRTENALVGKWLLTETLADPGDGSGTFQAVNSSKTLTFNGDGTVTSNGSICLLSIESNTSSSGTYSTGDSTITSSDCTNSPLALTYELDGSTLIINYPCIEACKGKFEKQ